MQETEYDVVQANFLEDALKALKLWGVISAQPSVVAQVIAVDALLGCAQDSGSVALRAYSLKESRTVAGAALVVNYDRLTSWQTVKDCFSNAVGGFSQLLGYEVSPCASWWEFSDDEAKYYMLQAGTSMYICTAMCDSMRGCTSPNLIADLVG